VTSSTLGPPRVGKNRTRIRGLTPYYPCLLFQGVRASAMVIQALGCLNGPTAYRDLDSVILRRFRAYETPQATSLFREFGIALLSRSQLFSHKLSVCQR